MKSSSKILILAIFLVFICCVSAASAAENDNVTASGDELAVEEVAADDVVDEQDTLASSEVDVDEKLAIDSPSECVIWVGTNSTPGGQGIEDDPFPTLDSACSAANNGGFKSKVTVNIKEGTYTIGSELKFNTSNLHINALDSKVVIKNVYNTATSKQSFSLVEKNNGNFTMSNVIFDGSGWTQYNSNNGYYTPFCNGNNNQIKFDNCTFTGFEISTTPPTGRMKSILPYSNKNQNLNIYNVYEFNNCKFINYTSESAYGIGLAHECNVSFVNCIFSAKYTGSAGIGLTGAKEVIFDSCWFGLNNIKHNSLFNKNQYIINIAKFARYAIFTISENYLGDNKYEIIGKLTWNDTTSDNIDKLGPMIVYLSADNGNIPNTATLENGTFNVTYTSSSDYHEITARLDQQTIKLNNNINFTLNSQNIKYGEDQNITLTFPDNATFKGTVYVTVNNKLYYKYCDSQNNITIPIGDKLPVGINNVVVKFESEPCEIFTIDQYYNQVYVHDVINVGFNTTTISVNKIIPNVNISREGDLVPGEKLIIKVEIPYATENVTIIVNGDKNTTKLVDNVATYTIDKLVQGTYYVTVLYGGDELCDFAYATDSFDVVKSTADLINDFNSTIETQKQQIDNLNSTVVAQNATIASQVEQIGNLNSTVVAQNATIVAQQKQINDLKKTSGKDVVNKKATKITAPKKTFKAKTKTKKIKIKLTTGKTALKNKKITLKVKGKTYSAKTNKKGIATFKITKLTKKGTFKYTVKFAGDKAYKAVSKNGNMKIK